MKTFATLCLLVVLLSIGSSVRAQVICPVYNGSEPPKSEGQEFLLCFMANEMPEETRGQYQEIYIASLASPAKVSIFCPNFGIDTSFDLGVFQTLTYHIDS